MLTNQELLNTCLIVLLLKNIINILLMDISVKNFLNVMNTFFLI